MDLLSIGEAARRVGMNASALRYYEDRGLVMPVTRQGGRRMYGPEELRRLMCLQIMQRLGLSLEDTGVVLNGPSEDWREVLHAQIAALDELVAQARQAQEFLRHALDCKTERPLRDCAFMIGMLDGVIEVISGQ